MWGPPVGWTAGLVTARRDLSHRHFSLRSAHFSFGAQVIVCLTGGQRAKQPDDLSDLSQRCRTSAYLGAEKGSAAFMELLEGSGTWRGKGLDS